MLRELEELREALHHYITANYHLSDPVLIERRDALLSEPGQLSQVPFVESSARYRSDRDYSLLAVPAPVRNLLTKLGEEDVINDPPYNHQARALEGVLHPDTDRRRDLIVTTGTGSGKTECFLLPILGRLADEASARPHNFEQHRALRALVLYPMNALVNDQLGRLRTLFGHARLRSWFDESGGRPVKFARYTGKTLFPGLRPDEDSEVPDKRVAARFRDKLGDLKFYSDLEARAHREQSTPGSDRRATDLIATLKRQGKWPAKAGTFASWYGSGSWQDRVRERHDDAELFLRTEVQENPADIIVTNYSMLEYMLLRPIERDIFEKTRRYLKETGEPFILVLDEAHLYRGVTGAEVGMLVRRLCRRLGVGPDQLRVIATSASFNTQDAAREFVAGLSGKLAGGFDVLQGDLKPFPAGSIPPSPDQLEALSQLAELELEKVAPAEGLATLQKFLAQHEGVFGKIVGRRAIVRREGAADGPLERVSTTLHGVDERLERVQLTVTLEAGELSTSVPPLAAIYEAELVSGQTSLSVTFEENGDAELLRLDGAGSHVHPGRHPLGRVLHDLLAPLELTSRLVDLTSGSEVDPAHSGRRLGPAKDLGTLRGALFGEAPAGAPALEALLELCPVARDSQDVPLLAARVHCFFRGLPGLWACVDPACTEVRGARTCLGKLYAQPRPSCGCGGRVYELYSCRDCGKPFLQAYAEDAQAPKVLFDSPGNAYGGQRLEPVSIAVDVMNPPADPSRVRQESLDLLTGQLAPSSRARPVWVPAKPWRAVKGFRNGQPQWGREHHGRFEACPHCDAGHQRSRYPIQDHVTSGDDPFLEVVRRQVLAQPARASSTAPLRGRKALMFSDSRQVAERIAARLQRGALQDSARPLLLLGLEALEERLGHPTALDHAYLAVLLGCATRGISARPDGDEAFPKDLEQVRDDLMNGRALKVPFKPSWVDEVEKTFHIEGHEVLAEVLTRVLHDAHTGFMAVGLASPIPVLRAGSREEESRARLSAPRGVSRDGSIDWSSVNEDRAKELVITLWLQLMLDRSALRVPIAPGDWVDNTRAGPRIKSNKGALLRTMSQLLPEDFYKTHYNKPTSPWRVHLMSRFATAEELLDPASMSFVVFDREAAPGWGRCHRCSKVQPLLQEVDLVRTGRAGTCRTCRAPTLELLEGAAMELFRARKQLYRTEFTRCRQDATYAPHPLQTAAHTAGISSSASDAATGRSEEYELRFQDVILQRAVKDGHVDEPPIDVLSVTTTMEVGIDIGSLTAVALRNVPPGRANYQQRAGRAGRRGSSLSMVLTWCGADSHDRNFFNDPARMISGEVPDPKLQIDNPDVLRRHLYAELLSGFRRSFVPLDQHRRSSNVFASLGSVDAFVANEGDAFTYTGLEGWLRRSSVELSTELRSLLPGGIQSTDELVGSVLDVNEAAVDGLLFDLREAGVGPRLAADVSEPLALTDEIDRLEARLESEPDDIIRAVLEKALREKLGELAAERARRSGLFEEDDSRPDQPAVTSGQGELLDHLFSRGLLPSYAFPTQVVTFHVFDSGGSSYGRPPLLHQPQRGLAQALSSYAPGREIWVDKAAYRSFAIYSTFSGNRAAGIPGDFEVMKTREQRYLECRSCGHVDLESPDDIQLGVERTCTACGAPARQGPAMRWVRPPGFAHPVFMGADRIGGEMVASRATNARLSARATGSGTELPGGRIKVWGDKKQELIWTNAGRSEDDERGGFKICLSCGLSEPANLDDGPWSRGLRPHPARQSSCNHRYSWSKVALGTTQRTDVAIIRLRLDPDNDPVRLRIADDASALASATRTALTTLTHAIVSAVVDLHDLEPDDLAGHYRVARTPDGQAGREVELYLYDAVSDGAGHSRRAAEELSKVLERAHEILADQDHNPDCQDACYDCLYSYRNRFQHGNLDRRLGLALLEYCRHGSTPALSANEQARLEGRLVDALQATGHEPERVDEHLVVHGTPVRLHHPLCPPDTGQATEEIWIDAWLAELNLPVAVSQALALGTGALKMPPGLQEVDQLHPNAMRMLDWSDLAEARTLEVAPRRHVRLEVDAPRASASTVLRVASLALTERIRGGGHYLLFHEAPEWATPQNIASSPDLSERVSNRHLLLLRADVGGESMFGGVQGPLAVGRVKRARRGDRLIVSFDARLPGAESTFFQPDEVIILGFVDALFHPRTGALTWLDN